MDIVIVGGGLAAAKAAESVRAQGFDGSVTLVAEEPHRPYERPPLSKGYLLGKQPLDEVYVHDAGYYEANDIVLITGDPVTALDRDAGRVLLRSGRSLPFDRLLLATGATPRRLPLAGSAPERVVTLRTLDDSVALRERLRAAGHVTVIGAGWIGCEVAAAARTLGAEVAMIDPLEMPLVRVLGRKAARLFADLHREHGVDLRTGRSVTDLEVGGDGVRVLLDDGQAIGTGLVVVGIGVVPRVELAEKAGLDVDNGVVVDETLATSDPRILAAGDIANAWHPSLGRRVRVEHWANALNQGLVAGRNLLDAGEVYDRVPYFFSDQYDLGMEYSGYAEPDDEVVFRGDPASREVIVFWVRDGRVVAGMNVNVWDVVGDIQALIRSGAPVTPSALADPDVPLRDLAAT